MSFFLHTFDVEETVVVDESQNVLEGGVVFQVGVIQTHSVNPDNVADLGKSALVGTRCFDNKQYPGW